LKQLSRTQKHENPDNGNPVNFHISGMDPRFKGRGGATRFDVVGLVAPLDPQWVNGRGGEASGSSWILEFLKALKSVS
jgi:hypothetical protein